MAFFNFFRRRRWERTGFELYAVAVAAARRPGFYAKLDVPDTLDGRFDMVGLHVFLLVRHLSRQKRPGPDLAQALFDAMFSDMDLNLREMGVGDMSISRKVRAMWDGFHGRAVAYTQALNTQDTPGLQAALARNVWRQTEDAPMPAGVPALADYVLAQEAHLSGQSLDALSAGRVHFMELPA